MLWAGPFFSSFLSFFLSFFLELLGKDKDLIFMVDSGFNGGRRGGGANEDRLEWGRSKLRR